MAPETLAARLDGPETRCVGSPGAWALCVDQPWDSDVLGVPCRAVLTLLWEPGTPHGMLADTVDSLVQEARRDGIGFMSVRLAWPCLPLVPLFESRGWRLADTLMTFLDQPGTASEKARNLADQVPGMVLRPMEAGDLDAVAGLASVALRGGRIDTDAAIGPDRKERFRRMLGRSFAERALGGDGFARIAEADGRLAGFTIATRDAVTSETTRRPHGHLSLIAVEPALRRGGTGRCLLADFRRQAATAFDTVEISTQVTNRPAIGLYLRAGLRLAGGLHTLHWHADS